MKHSIFLLVAIITLASCGGGDGKTNNKKAELDSLQKVKAELDARIQTLEADPSVADTNAKPVPVTVLEMQPVNFVSYIEVQSQIAGDENVLATPQMNGTVRSISVRPGQRVSRGQVLAILDAAAVDQEIAALEPTLILQKALYEKQQKLWSQNIGTEVQLLTAKATYQATLKQKFAVIARRNMYRIVSPINGTVDDVSLKVGDAAMPGGQQGIRVVSFDKLKAEANLGENYLGKVQAGDPVVLILNGGADSIETKLSYVAQSVDPISRAFMVQVRLGANKKLTPNMSAKMKIANYENKSALTVPVSVIQKTAQGDMVYVVNGNRAKAVIVKTGRNSNGMVEILGGLSVGDKVITEVYADLENGERIAMQ